MGGLGLLSNTMIHGTTSVSLPNGISFHPTALAGCINLMDIWTDIYTDHARGSSVGIGIF